MTGHSVQKQVKYFKQEVVKNRNIKEHRRIKNNGGWEATNILQRETRKSGASILDSGYRAEVSLA